MVTEKAITVRELIAELSKMPQDAIALAEGCDCYGEVGGCELTDSWGGHDTKAQFVLVQRRTGG